MRSTSFAYVIASHASHPILSSTIVSVVKTNNALETIIYKIKFNGLVFEAKIPDISYSYSQDASTEADVVATTAEVVSSKEMDQWLSSTEALEMKKIELEIESEIISEARTTLNNTIEFSVENDKRERESLCKKKDVLMNELENLLALVKQKEEEIAKNDSDIKAVDKRIGGVVSGFQEMQSRIDGKFDNLQLNLSDIGLDSNVLLSKKKEIDEFLYQEEHRGAKLKELAQIAAEEAKTYQEVVGLRKSLMLSVSKSREDKIRLAKTEEKLSEDVKMLQKEVSTSRASLQVYHTPPTL